MWDKNILSIRLCKDYIYFLKSLYLMQFVMKLYLYNNEKNSFIYII